MCALGPSNTSINSDDILLSTHLYVESKNRRNECRQQNRSGLTDTENTLAVIKRRGNQSGR